VTRSSATRRERRRERKEHRRKRDQAAIDLSAALQVAWKLSGRQANDLAIAWLEGREIEPTKQPRGSKRRGPASILVGYEHVLRTSFAGRDATLRQKVKRGGAAPHPGVRCRELTRCANRVLTHRSKLHCYSITSYARLTCRFRVDLCPQLLLS
jgi:hypothetical protein